MQRELLSRLTFFDLLARLKDTDGCLYEYLLLQVQLLLNRGILAFRYVRKKTGGGLVCEDDFIVILGVLEYDKAVVHGVHQGRILHNQVKDTALNVNEVG